MQKNEPGNGVLGSLWRLVTLDTLAVALGRRWHYAWVLLASAIVIVTISAGLRNSFGVFVSPLVQTFGWPVGAVSFAYFLLFVSGVPMTLLGGWLADRFGVRPVAIVCVLVFIAGLLLTAHMTELWHFYVFYATLVGGSSVVFTTLLPVTMTQWFQRRAGTAVGLTFAAAGLGPFVLVIVFSWLITTSGWTTAFTTVGMIAGIPMVLAALLVRSGPAEMGQLAYGRAAPAAAAPKPRPAAPVDLGAIRRQRTIWLLIAIHLLGCVGHAVPLAHLVRLAVLKGVPDVVAAGLLSTVSVMSILSRLGVPMLIERGNPRLILALGYGLQSLAVLAYLLADGIPALYIVSILFGLAFGAEMSAFPILNRQYYGTHAPLNSLHAWEMAGALVGMGIGGWFGGLLFDWTGSYLWSILFAVAVGLAAVPLIMALPRKGQRPALAFPGHAGQGAMDMHLEHG